MNQNQNQNQNPNPNDEKIVSLNEDSKFHEHDNASYQKLLQQQQKEIDKNKK